MTELVLFDDATARAFEPLTLTRPACELRAGALLLRERWERALGARASGVATSPHLAGFDEPWAHGARPLAGVIRAGTIVANARCAVGLTAVDTRAKLWRCGGRVAAVRLARDMDVAELAIGNGAATLETMARDVRDDMTTDVTGWWMNHIWDFTRHLAEMLTADVAILSASLPRVAAGRAAIVGGDAHGVFAEDGATIEPHVVFDVSGGPILLRRGATVQAFTRLGGPCIVGEHSQVGGDKIVGCSVGDTCKVHGEVNATIFLGHCNKAHDGFVGCSYLGRWVNLGADTVTSNLKNTYGAVRFWTPGGEADSGLQFLGTYFGDHAKTGIGTMLPTGCVIGAGANVYGAGLTPKVVPPFAWGDGPPYETFRIDKFLEVARRVMERRHVTLSDAQTGILGAAFERRWST